MRDRNRPAIYGTGPIQTILLAVAADPSPVAAAQRAAWLARRSGARIVLLHVISPEASPLDWEALQRELAPLLEGVAVHPLLRRGPPAREILAAARDEHADLIVATRHGRWQAASELGFPRFLLRSVLCRLLMEAACPVWVEPETGAPPEIARILCGVASLVHDQDTILGTCRLAAITGTRPMLFRSAVGMTIAVPGQQHRAQAWERELIVAATADMAAVCEKLAVTADIRIGIGTFAAALLRDAEAAAAGLVVLRRTSREWGRDDTMHPLVHPSLLPVLVFPGPPPVAGAARRPPRHPRLAAVLRPAMVLAVLLLSVWLMHKALAPARPPDCQAQPERCPVLNGYINTAKERASPAK